MAIDPATAAAVAQAAQSAYQFVSGGETDIEEDQRKRDKWWFKRLNQLANQYRQGRSFVDPKQLERILAMRNQSMSGQLGRLGRRASKRLNLGSGIAWQNIGGNQGQQLSRIIGDMGAQEMGINADIFRQIIASMGQVGK